VTFRTSLLGLGVWAAAINGIACYATPQADAWSAAGELAAAGAPAESDRSARAGSAGGPELDVAEAPVDGLSGGPLVTVAGALQITTASLREGCVNEPYCARVTARGGAGHYYWTAEHLPAGLVLDSDTGELSGTPARGAAGPQTLDVHVGSSSAENVTLLLPLFVHASCKLAFIAANEGARRLYLSDVREGVPQELSDSATAVASFRWSEDGTRLAFQNSPASASKDELQLVTIAPQRSPTVELLSQASGAARLLHYAWATLSPRLAVIATDAAGESRQLLVFDGDGGLLGSAAVPSHISDLFWVGDRACFHGTSSLGRESIRCHQLGADGLSAASEEFYRNLAFAFEGAGYITGPSFFIGQFSDGPGAPFQLVYQAVPGGLAITHDPGVPSPDLRWIARVAPSLDAVAANELQLFPSGEDETAPVSVISACDELQAWSADARYLACRSGESVLIAELDATGRVVRQGSVPGIASGPAELRHAFSPASEAGRWYVVESLDQGLVAIDLTQSVWMATFLTERGERSVDDVGLEFLGRRPELLYHHDVQLERFDLARGQHTLVSLTPITGPLACAADPLRASPDLWCGGQRGPRQFVTAPGGDAVAFQAEDGTLWVLDAHLDPGEPTRVSELYVPCGDGDLGCADQVGFAP
jgi:hypothetical protein